MRARTHALARSAAAPAIAVGLGGLAALLWRLLSWPPAQTFDAWAYTAWGQAIAHGERPLYELAATTPKPLATLLGALVTPLPPERGMAIVVVVALAVLAAALFAAADRAAGPLAAVVGVAVLAFSARLDVVVWGALIDGVVAALVALAVALRGKGRVAALVGAGLLRPEAWALAAVAGFLGSRGRVLRRGSVAVAAGLVAPVLWLTLDAILTGDPLATVDRGSRIHEENDLEVSSLSHIVRVVGSRLLDAAGSGGAAIVLLGLLGLGLHAWRGGRHGERDYLPLAIVVVWTGLLTIEARYAPALNVRYFLPTVVVLALGCGMLAAALVPPTRRWRPWAGGALACAALGAGVAAMDLEGPSATENAARSRAVKASLPALREALDCGRLGTTGSRRANGLIPQLAAASRRPLDDFGRYRGDARRFAAVIRFEQGGTLPPWPRYELPLGELALAPRCGELQPPTD